MAKIELDNSVCKLRHHWKDRLTKIRYILLSPSLSATFKLQGRNFEVSIPSGFDVGTSTILISENEGDIDDLFYSVISDLVFEHPPTYISSPLQQAIEKDFNDNSIVVPKVKFASEEEGDDNLLDEIDEEIIGEVKETHTSTIIDPQKNLPQIKPITEESALSYSTKSKISKGNSIRGKGVQSKIKSKIEKIHILELKSVQYAWHCQICLAEKTPGDLAPVGSYVEFSAFRSKLIEAHHLDQVHAGGARHAGNILLMCQKHHNLLGDKLSRQAITEELKGEIKSMVIEFKSEDDTVLIDGRVIRIMVQSIGEDLRCFFTHAHAETWLNNLDEN